MKDGIEVEIKLRLLSQHAYNRVQSILGNPINSDLHENVFFDTLKNDLGHQQTALRFRLSKDNQHPCIMTIKSKTTIQNGIQKSNEQEEEVDYGLIQSIMKDPSSLVKIMQPSNINILNNLLSTYSITPDTPFHIIAQYSTHRLKYHFNEHILELDHTMYSFGDLYEIEIETHEPELVIGSIVKLLEAHGIPYVQSKSNKLGNALRGSLID